MNFKTTADTPRWMNDSILESLQTRRVVLLSGARQCGKTTLAKSIPNAIYRTLDDVALLAAAQNDPHGFVQHGDGLMIIDEIQRAPVLLQAIKKEVDENRKMGRFLLTGSANIQALPSTRESLAGRVAMQRLRSFSMGECLGVAPSFMAGLTDPAWLANVRPNLLYGKDQVLRQALRGGYPEVQDLSDGATQRWHRDYLRALLARDLQDVANIRRKDSMQKLLQVLAAWTSKLMDVSAIGSQLALARPTLESYINALESLYIVERVRPWSKTDYARVSKQDKLFMTDTGLAASLLSWTFAKTQFDADVSGKLIESYVFAQLAAQLDAQDAPYELTHYRDREGREIDFVIETQDGLTIGIEVKAGSSIEAKQFKHLAWFRDTMLAKNAPFIGLVLYTGEHAVSFGDKLWAVPMAALWS